MLPLIRAVRRLSPLLNTLPTIKPPVALNDIDLTKPDIPPNFLQNLCSERVQSSVRLSSVVTSLFKTPISEAIDLGAHIIASSADLEDRIVSLTAARTARVTVVSLGIMKGGVGFLYCNNGSMSNHEVLFVGPGVFKEADSLVKNMSMAMSGTGIMVPITVKGAVECPVDGITAVLLLYFYATIYPAATALPPTWTEENLNYLRLWALSLIINGGPVAAPGATDAKSFFMQMYSDGADGGYEALDAAYHWN